MEVAKAFRMADRADEGLLPFIDKAFGHLPRAEFDQLFPPVGVFCYDVVAGDIRDAGGLLREMRLQPSHVLNVMVVRGEAVRPSGFAPDALAWYEAVGADVDSWVDIVAVRRHIHEWAEVARRFDWVEVWRDVCAVARRRPHACATARAARGILTQLSYLT